LSSRYKQALAEKQECFLVNEPEGKVPARVMKTWRETQVREAVEEVGRVVYETI
jgi:hypothetical protein